MNSLHSPFAVSLDLKRPLPDVLDVGVPFTIELAVETDSGCDLCGAPFSVRDESGAEVTAGVLPPIVGVTAESPAYDPRHGPVDMRPSTVLTLLAPDRIGHFEWSLLLPEFTVGSIPHKAAEVPMAVSTRAHVISLVVWDTPGPVEMGKRFKVKIGAKCSSGCRLAGETVEIVDDSGTVVARGRLGDSPWTGTVGLYWTDVELVAPTAEGLCRWTSRMAAPERDLPHGTAPAGLSFVCTEAPEHRVQVTLIEAQTGRPVEDAQVRFGPFRGATDETGSARFLLPAREFSLVVSKQNHDVPARRITVNADLALTIEAVVHPDRDPYERYWK